MADELKSRLDAGSPRFAANRAATERLLGAELYALLGTRLFETTVEVHD